MQERLCSGPSHSQPTLLPDTDKYFYTRKRGPDAGKRHPTCRLCRAWRDGIPLDEAGLIPFTKLQPFIIEGVNRVGTMEFSRRVGVAYYTVYVWLGKRKGRRPQHIRKKQAKRIVLELVSMRRKNEVRHRKSIHRGSAKRGEQEKVPTTRKDYYRSHGDADTQTRLRYTRNLAPDEYQATLDRRKPKRRKVKPEVV